MGPFETALAALTKAPRPRSRFIKLHTEQHGSVFSSYYRLFSEKEKAALLSFESALFFTIKTWKS